MSLLLLHLSLVLSHTGLSDPPRDVVVEAQVSVGGGQGDGGGDVGDSVGAGVPGEGVVEVVSGVSVPGVSVVVTPLLVV